jgi:hypothetical protein
MDYYTFHNDHIRRVSREKLLKFKAMDECESWEFLASEVPEGAPVRTGLTARAANQLMTSVAVYGVGIWIAVAVFVWSLVWVFGNILVCRIVRHVSRHQRPVCPTKLHGFMGSETLKNIPPCFIILSSGKALF